jgi:hypothetical protein
MRRDDCGRSLIGLLVALALLGGLAAVVLLSQASGAKDQGNQSTGTTINASPNKAAVDIQAAAGVTCRTDYKAVVTAVSEYAALNGKQPTAIGQVAPMMRQPITSTRFVISINPARPGQVEVAAGGHPAASGNCNCAYAG